MNDRLLNAWQKIVHSQAQISSTLTLILLVLSAWIIGQIIWLIPTSSRLTTFVPWQANTLDESNTQSIPNSNDVNPLLKANLFGQYNAETSPTMNMVIDAPKTQLDLILVGAVSSSDPKTSLAVISQNGSQTTYAIDEQIRGSQAIIKSIFADRVIIDNGGKNETLMLEGLEYKRLEIMEPTRQPIALNIQGNNPQSAEEKMEHIKTELLQHPQQIFEYVRLSQVKKNDEIKGYRVSPGKDPKWFEAIGLQNGDIATHINGLDVTTPTAMTQILASASELTELTLTVERNGQPHEIVIEF